MDKDVLEALRAAQTDPVMVDPYEALKGAYETGTDPYEWIRVNGYQRHGALTRKARNLRANMRAARVAKEREERARAREARAERIAVMGRMVRCGGGYLTERERDAIRAHLDVKGRLTPEHMERAGYGLVDGEWVGSLDVWAAGHKAY